MELMELLRKNNMKEAANSIFEMAAYVDVMEKKMDSVLEELAFSRNSFVIGKHTSLSLLPAL